MKKKPYIHIPGIFSCLKTSLLITIIFCSNATRGQSPYDAGITSSQITVGKTPSGTGVPATEISFPTFIYAAHFDSTRNELLAVIRERSSKYFKNKGALVVINPENGAIKWSKEITNSHFDLQFTKGHIVSIRQEETVVYDRSNGSQLWRRPVKIKFVDEKNRVILAVNGVGFDLHTGQKKWQASFDYEFDWTPTAHPNDTTFLLIATGLTGINLRTGKNWTYATRTDFNKYASLKTYSTFVDSGLVYFASRDVVACIATTGKIIWQTGLVKKNTGEVHIWKHKNRILLVNNAYTFQGIVKTDIGFPYLAAFDKKTGKQLYLNQLDTRRSISSAIPLADTIFAHAYNRVFKYNLTTGEKILEVNTENGHLDRHTQFCLPQAFYVKASDDQYRSLSELYPGNMFLSNEHNIIRINSRLEPAGMIDQTLWELYYEYKDLQILKHKKELVLIRDGKVVGFLTIDKATVHGNWLIDSGATSLKIIDLKSLAN